MSRRRNALEAKYPLNTPEGVFALLSNIHRVANDRLYKSDFDAVDLILDLYFTSRKVTLTGRQAEAVHLIFIKDLTQTQAAHKMGISQQAVQQHLWAAVRRIAKKYRQEDNEGGLTNGNRY